jgi:hypothetical protein
MHTRFLQYSCLTLGLWAGGVVVASPSSGTFASSSAAGSGSDTSVHGGTSQGNPVHNDEPPARTSAASTHASAPLNSDLPDDGTRDDTAPRSAKPDLGWPALLPGSIW